MAVGGNGAAGESRAVDVLGPNGGKRVPGCIKENPGAGRRGYPFDVEAAVGLTINRHYGEDRHGAHDEENVPLVCGGKDNYGDLSYVDRCWTFDGERWKQAGRMSTARYVNKIATFQSDQIERIIQQVRRGSVLPRSPRHGHHRRREQRRLPGHRRVYRGRRQLQGQLPAHAERRQRRPLPGDRRKRSNLRVRWEASSKKVDITISIQGADNELSLTGPTG